MNPVLEFDPNELGATWTDDLDNKSLPGKLVTLFNAANVFAFDIENGEVKVNHLGSDWSITKGNKSYVILYEAPTN